MNTYNKETLRLCLKNNINNLSLQIILSRILNIIFVLYCFFILYFLIFDTTYIVSIKLYDNKYISVTVCLLSSVIGLLIFIVSQWNGFLAKIKLYSKFENIDIPKFSFYFIAKRLIIKISTLFLKMIIFAVLMIPSGILFVLMIKSLTLGVSIYVFCVIGSGFIFMFALGFFNSFCLCQRYSMCDYCMIENKYLTVGKIIKMSVYLMNGKSEKVAKYKLLHLIPTILGFVFPFFTVVQSSAAFIISTDKIIPYVQKNAHTEKPLVFYFNKQANIKP